ncbi:MAG: hypothetical protein AB2401_02350, partial [Bacillus sp. (in: firmicutes)]
MKKQTVVKSLKSIVYTGAFALGLSLFGGHAGAEELDVTKELTNVTPVVEQVAAQNVLSTLAAPVAATEEVAATALETPVIPTSAPVVTGNPEGIDPSVTS